jgi:hypothetical protein
VRAPEQVPTDVEQKLEQLADLEEVLQEEEIQAEEDIEQLEAVRLTPQRGSPVECGGCSACGLRLWALGDTAALVVRDSSGGSVLASSAPWSCDTAS